MKIHSFALVCLALFICTGLPCHAQKESKRLNEHYIDLALGAGFNTSSYNSSIGEICFQGRRRAAFRISMRYQYFFHKNWGAILSLNTNESSPYTKEKLVEKMENGAQPHYYAYIGSLNKAYVMQSTYNAGIMYRQDVKSWSFRPYISLGCARYMNANVIEYMRKSVGSNHAEHIKVTVGNGSDSQFGLCVAPGISISKSIARIVYLIADLSYPMHTRSFTANYQRTNVYTHEVIEQYNIKEKPGNFIDLKVGLSVRLSKK